MGFNLIFGVFGLVLYLFVLLLPIALLVALQVWLCRKSSRLGLILPGITLVLSLLLTLTAGLSIGVLARAGNTLTVRNETTGEIIQQSDGDMQINPAAFAGAGALFLVTNIPTVVFGGIWLHYKGRQDIDEALKRMQIQDLE